MPSIKNITLAAVGLIGMASAFPQATFQNTTVPTNGTETGPVSGGNTNTTTPTGPISGGNTNTTTPTGPVSGNNGTNTSDNSLFCPNLNAQIFITPNSASFIIECNTNHFGTVIQVSISGFNKRQAAGRPTNLGQCLNLCDGTATCVGAAFNSVQQSCTLFSNVGAAFTDNAASFGVRVASGAAVSQTAGATVTSTILSTQVVTVSACAPTVTNCPYNAGAVATQVFPVGTTTYICPTATAIPVAPVACGCAYGVSTLGAYRATVTLGSTILVPVTSTVVAVPSPSGTVYVTATCPAGPYVTGYVNYNNGGNNGNNNGGVSSTVTVACPTCPGGVSTSTVPAGSAITSVATVCNGSGCPVKSTPTPTSSMAVYTGAAAQVKAGMGMGAVVAAAALLL